jgi:two-component system response regulator HupR/HoxA
VEGHGRFAAILGESAPMRRLKALLEKVIPSPASVLILGESGTGKELVARALHYEGPRRERNFVAENCAALPESLLEGELFGFSRGAFTGAVHDKPGLLEVADGGTLFLDEIADTLPAVQAKLLRVLESGEYRRLGETEVKRSNVRVLAATSRDLAREVEAGRFRPELYYRLGGLAVQVPSLRERPDDIPLLVRHFLAEYGRRTDRGPIAIEPEVIAVLQQNTWPGNVRQLRNEVERMAALADDGQPISVALMSPEVQPAHPVAATRLEGESLPEALERIKRTLIEEALTGCTGNRSRAAVRLGVSRPNLQKMMRRLDIH